MFIDIKILERLMKKAWKERGLHLENDGRGITVSADYWAVFVEKDSIPNKLKAAMVEFAGRIPEVGECFTVYEKSDEQAAVNKAFYDWSVIEEGMNDSADMKHSKLFYEQNGTICRIMQVPGTGNTYLINNVFACWTSNRQLEEDEPAPEGPLLTPNGIVLWDNGTCKALCYVRDREEEDAPLEILQKEVWY